MQLTTALMVVCGVLAIEPVHEIATIDLSAASPRFATMLVEECLTGESQCKAWFDFSDVPEPNGGPCEMEFRMKPGSTLVHGSCKCEGDPIECVENSKCEFDGTVQGKVTTAGRIVTSGTDCGATGTWTDLYLVNDQELDCGSTDDTVPSFACYDGTCTSPGTKMATVFVRTACRACNGTCPGDPN